MNDDTATCDCFSSKKLTCYPLGKYGFPFLVSDDLFTTQVGFEVLPFFKEYYLQIFLEMLSIF